MADLPPDDKVGIRELGVVMDMARGVDGEQYIKAVSVVRFIRQLAEQFADSSGILEEIGHLERPMAIAVMAETYSAYLNQAADDLAVTLIANDVHGRGT